MSGARARRTVSARRLLAFGSLVAAAGLVLAPPATAAHTGYSPPLSSGSDFATDFPTCSGVGPTGLVFDATSFFVVDYCDGNIYRLPATGGSVSSAPHTSDQSTTGFNIGLAVQGGHYYAGVAEAPTLGIYEFDPVTLNATRAVAPGYDVRALAADPTNGALWFTTCGTAGMGIGKIASPTDATPAVDVLPLDAGSLCFDGMTLSADGGTVYVADYNDQAVRGFSTATGHQVLAVSLAGHGPDGIAIASPNTTINGVDVSGNLFVNANDGTILMIDTHAVDPGTQEHTYPVSVVADGGSRGDFATVGPDGCFYVTQTDVVEKLLPCIFETSAPPTSPAATTTTYTGPTTVQYSDPATFTGTLTDQASPPAGVAGRTLSFTLGTMSAAVSGASSASGAAASSAVPVTLKPGAATMATAFAGDTSYAASSDSDTVTVTKESCTLSLPDGDLLVSPATSTTLRAQLGELDSSPGSWTGKLVTFTVTDAAMVASTYTALTSAAGTASTTLPLPQGVYGVSAAFAGDDYYTGCSTPPPDAIVTVEAALARATGGGWISQSTGRTSFGFNAVPQAGGVYTGQFQLRASSGKSRFHGSTVTTLTSATAHQATWTGTGRWNGVAGYTYLVTAVDNGAPGAKKADTVSIVVYRTGDAAHPVFTTSGAQPLKGGNLIVR